MCRNVDIRMNRNDLVSVRRLGKRTSQKPRPIKVEMRHKELKFAFLNKRKSITRNQEIQTYFQNKVFVNTDNSFLVQREENRLRVRLKEMGRSEPNTNSYIRAGVLYQDDHKVDEVDVRNQLF